MKPVKNWLRKTPDVKGSFKSKSFRVGSYSMAATAIVIAIAIVINLSVAEIPSKYTIFDTTSTQLFSISDQTETIVENLDMDITIYWIVQDGNEDSTIQTLLEQYEGMSNKVKVVKRDPDVYPTFVQQYASELRYNNSLVVESELRYVFVDYDEIYLYEYSYSDDYYYTGNYEETVSFNGEGALTKAIDYVISEDIPKIYHLTGHGETSLSTTYTEAIAKENVELEELILLNQEAVPEDADCILIHAPQSDIADEEKEMLLAYLQAGGKMLLISGISQGKKETPNLDALMADYGVSAAEGMVIEGDTNHYVSRAPYYLMPDINTHTITTPLKNGGYYVLTPMTSGLFVADDLRDGVSVTKLLTTSDKAFSKVAGYEMTTYEKETGDVDGPFALAVAITDTSAEEKAQIVWIATNDFLSDSLYSTGNGDVFLNAINWMCEGGSSVSIRAKELTTEYLTLSTGEISSTSTIIVGIVPVCYLLIGICIWIRRKRG